MKYLTNSKCVIYGIFMLFLTANLSAQEASITVSQDSKFEQILTEKRKLNATIATNDRYKIQIFSGDNESAKRNLADFRKDNKMIDGTIVFNTPNYKVLVGNFKTRVEAERNLIEILKKNPKALLIKPSK